MTSDEILALKPGRELDLLIDDLMGCPRWEVVGTHTHDGVARTFAPSKARFRFNTPENNPDGLAIWDRAFCERMLAAIWNADRPDGPVAWEVRREHWCEWSEDLGAADKVLGLLRRRFTDIQIHLANGCGVRCWNVGVGGKHSDPLFASGDSPAHAICLAALLASPNYCQLGSTN